MTIVTHPGLMSDGPVQLTVPEQVQLLDDQTLAEFVDAGGDARPCSDRDPEDYYPVVGPKLPKLDGKRYIEEQEKARKLCAGCPVRAECLELGLRRERFGVWGGSSEWERTVMRAVRRADSAAKAAS